MATVLVAEDDRTTSLLICSVLKKGGHIALPAFDAMQTVMFAMRSVPDVVVLDLHMPGGTGLEALRKLRSSSRTVNVPVILLSGSASAEQRQEVESLGVTTSLEKPVDGDRLLSAVESALNGQ